MSLDPVEIIQICQFGAQETFLIIGIFSYFIEIIVKNHDTDTFIPMHTTIEFFAIFFSTHLLL